MSKLKANFSRNYKVNSHQQVCEEVTQWISDILNGDDNAVRLTDIVLSNYKSEDRAYARLETVWKIQGYQVVRLGRSGSELLSIYSPLAKRMLGCTDRLHSYITEHPAIPYYLTNAIDDKAACIGLDPLDDDTSKRAMLAGKCTVFPFWQLCMFKRESNPAAYYTRYVTEQKQPLPELLAMVSLINSMPIEERKRIQDVYDSYGTIDTIVGDALDHIDKFRTL
jgi:hypothetical protein